jgi:hypothetical protein
MDISIVGAALGGAALGATVVAIVFVNKTAKLQRKINELLAELELSK